MREKKKNYVIVFALFVLFLAVGYSTFVQPLADKLPIWTPGDWCVGFVDAEKVKTTGNASENNPVSYDLTRGWFNVNLTQPGDSITYEFTIQNKGNITAKVNGIYVYTGNNSFVSVKTDGLGVGEVLKPKQKTKLRVTAKYKENYNGLPANTEELLVIVNYVQK